MRAPPFHPGRWFRHHIANAGALARNRATINKDRFINFNLAVPMSLFTIAEIVFFLVFGISHFYPFKHSQTITAVAAIVIGVLMLVRF